MPSANAIKAGAAYVELYLKDGMSRGLKKASARLTAWGGAMQGMGAKIAAVSGAAMAPFMAAVKSFMDGGDQLNKMAARTGMTVEALSSLAFAAEQSGADLTTLEGGLRGMARTLLNAERGLSTAVDSLDILGLSADQLQGQSPEDQFLTIADAVARIENPSTKAAVAMQVFGRAGQKILPMLSEGRLGIAKLRQEAGELGRTMSTDQAQAAADMTDAWNRLKSLFIGVKNTVGAALVPTLLEAAETTKQWGKQLAGFISQNQGVIVSLFKLTAVGAAVGTGLLAVGTAIVGVGAVLGSLAGIAAAVGSAFGVVTSVLGALLSPLVLVAAAIVGLAGYFLYSQGVVGQAVGFMRQKLAELGQWFERVWGGIRDALAAGDLKLAGEIAMAGLKVAWVAGMKYLTDKWVDFKSVVVQTWSDVTFAIVDYAATAWDNLKIGFHEAVAGLKIIWAEFTTGFKDKWEGAQRFLAKGMAMAMAKAQGLDPNEAAKAVDDDYDRRKKKRHAETDDYKAQVGRESQQRRKTAEEERDLKATIRQEDHARATAERNKRYHGDRVAAQRELDEARSALDTSLAKSKSKTLPKPGPTDPGDGPPSLPDPAALNKIGAGMSGGGKNLAGAFSAAALAGLGGDVAADRTARATEETAALLRRMAKRRNQGKFVFTGATNP